MVHSVDSDTGAPGLKVRFMSFVTVIDGGIVTQPEAPSSPGTVGVESRVSYLTPNPANHHVR